MSRQSPLAASHADRGASFTAFGGWEMPVTFDSIRIEHAAVRESVGRFDVSHMGEIEVSGPDAAALTQRLVTNDVSSLAQGEARYSAITDEAGVMLEDTVVYRLPAEADAEYLFVPNAGNDRWLAERWRTHRDRWDLDAAVANVTDETAMVAVQGPDAAALLGGHAAGVDALDRFEVTQTTVAGVAALVSRTGYTGEDGFEVLCPADAAETVWTALDCQPCGLGARDTLRIEMGYLLAGQEFDPDDEPRNPFEAGIGFTVNLETEFVGRDALERVDAEGVAERLVGFSLVDRGVPRHGYAVTDEAGTEIGHVTSGTVSPTLDEPIGMAYVPVAHAEPDTPLRVVVRGEPKRARVRPRPFVDR